MYLQNKYTRIYDNIIERAKSRTIDAYTETHHIIPRSLGGSDDSDNLVKLTAKEHFICHLLLPKMLLGESKNKMVYALWCMANQENEHQQRIKITSATYSCIREEFSEIHSDWLRKNHKTKILPKVMEYWTEERRQAHGEVISKLVTGRTHSEQTKEKMRNKQWSEKALKSRLNNCLKAAEARKGSNWSSTMRTAHEEGYFIKHKEMAKIVFEMYDAGLSKNVISKKLHKDWYTVSTIINRRLDFEARDKGNK